MVPDGGNRQPGLHRLEHLHPQLLLDTHPHPSQRVREVVCVPVPKSWSCGVQTGCRFCPSAAFNGRFHVSLQSPRSKIPQSHAITGTRLAMTYASSSSSTNRTCAVAQRQMSHVHTSTRHTSHVTRHTSHVTRHTRAAQHRRPINRKPVQIQKLLGGVNVGRASRRGGAHLRVRIAKALLGQPPQPVDGDAAAGHAGALAQQTPASGVGLHARAHCVEGGSDCGGC